MEKIKAWQISLSNAIIISRLKIYFSLSTQVQNTMESLILAQDERWRYA